MAKKTAQSAEESKAVETGNTMEAKSEVVEELDEEVIEPAEDIKDLIPLLSQLPAEQREIVTNLLAEMQPSQAGLEEMDSRWSPPFIKIRQGMSTDHPASVQLGQLYTDDGEVLTTPFELVPLYMYPANLKFDEGQSTPSCRSEDGKVSIFGTPCKDCPDEPFKHGEPTDCSRYRNTFVFDVGFKRIYRLNLGKTSYKAGSKLQRYMKGSGGKPWKKIYALEVQQQQRKSGQGNFFVFNIRPTGKEVDNSLMIELAGKFKNRISAIRAEILRVQREKSALAEKKTETLGNELNAGSTSSAGKKPGEPDFREGM